MKKRGKGYYAKDGQLYLRVRREVEAKGKTKVVWGGAPSGYVVGQERTLEKLIKRAREHSDNTKAVTGYAGPATVGTWCPRWIVQRKRDVVTWKNDESVMRLHVLPTMQFMRLDEVRPHHVKALVVGWRTKLAPKSVWTAYSTLSAFFRDAAIEGLITERSTPCILTKHQLGEKRTKDRDFALKAIFARDELERLISEESIPMDRRVLYGLKGIAGLRHSEAAGLTWERCPVDIIKEPLEMLYAHGKDGIDRPVPIHPTLAAMLAEWRLHGWRAMMGRAPQKSDLVVPWGPPSPFDQNITRRQGHNPSAPRTRQQAQDRFLGDLEALGMRPRRGHDLRRTMISLSRSDGARVDILKRATHKPPKDVIEGYTTYEWSVVCAEVVKFKVSRKSTGRKLLAMPIAANDSRGQPTPSEGFATVFATESGQVFEFNPETCMALPGLEPGGLATECDSSARSRSGGPEKTDGCGRREASRGHDDSKPAPNSRSKVANGGLWLSPAALDVVRCALRIGLTATASEEIQEAIELLNSSREGGES